MWERETEHIYDMRLGGMTMSLVLTHKSQTWILEGELFKNEIDLGLGIDTPIDEVFARANRTIRCHLETALTMLPK